MERNLVQSIKQVSRKSKLRILYDRTKLVRIGSKINYTNRANPRKTTTSSNYSQVPEIVELIDEDSTVYYRPLSHGGHFESQENKKLCFCTSSLALEERLDVQNLLFQHCVIKVYCCSLFRDFPADIGFF